MVGASFARPAKGTIMQYQPYRSPLMIGFGVIVLFIFATFAWLKWAPSDDPASQNAAIANSAMPTPAKQDGGTKP